METSTTVADHIIKYMTDERVAKRAAIIEAVRESRGDTSEIAVDKALAQLEKDGALVRPGHGTYVLTEPCEDPQALVPMAIQFAFDEIVPRRVALFSGSYLQWRILCAPELTRRYLVQRKAYIPPEVFDEALQQLLKDGLIAKTDIGWDVMIVGRDYFVATKDGFNLHKMLNG